MGKDLTFAFAPDGAAPDAAAADEPALIAAAARNPEAFGELYRLYMPRVYRYLRTRTLSVEEASDLTQTAFLRAFASLSSYQSDRAPFAAWLFRIARNAATDAHRRRRPAASWERLGDGAAPEEPSASPQEQAEQHERSSRLHEAIQRLDPGKRELLALKYAGGLTNQEIAALLGKNEAAVKKMSTRMLSALREYYHE